jgi:AI-2 transport system ATP-binding protein
MPDVGRVTDPSESAGVAPPLVSLKGVWKVFESVPVLRGISFDLKAGEIHALLGGNGSGKSTTVKILCGAHKPTAGIIELNGQPQDFDRPSDAHAKGIYMVPQEPHIFPNQTVRENLLIGLAGDARAYAERCERLARELGLTCDFSTCAGELSIANQQLIEIIRGLLRNAGVLIFDEPTSALTIREVKSLFGQMKKLSADGIGIFFISHRLNEVLEISDRVSVLRDGVFVLSAPTKTLTTNDLVAAMRPAGSEPTQAPEQVRSSAPQSPTPALEVKNLSGKMFHEVSFKVFPGEVVGLAGLVGAGRTELAEAILGIDQHVNGDVAINGQAAAAQPTHLPEAGASLRPGGSPRSRHIPRAARRPNDQRLDTGATRTALLVGETRRRGRRAIRAAPRHQAVEPGPTRPHVVGRQPAESGPREGPCGVAADHHPRRADPGHRRASASGRLSADARPHKSGRRRPGDFL